MTHTLRLAWIVPAAIVVAGCGSGSGARGPVVTDSAGITITTNTSPRWAPGEEWRLSERPVMSIGGEGDSVYELVRITGIVRLSDGSIVLAMRRPHVVYLYDSTGRFVRSIGRAGQGPAEYNQPQTVLPMPGDSLLVPDLGSSPIYSRDGAVGGRVKLAPPARSVGESSTLGAVPNYAFADGSLAAYIEVYSLRRSARTGAAAGTDSVEIVRYSRDGEPLASFGVFDNYYATCDERACYPQMAGIEREFAAGPDALYTGNGATFEIRVHGLDGRVRRIIRVDRPGIRFTNDSANARIERAVERDPARAVETRADFRKVTHRDTLPHFSRLVAGADGTLWVGEYTATYEPTRWQVFDREGAWLGTIDTPARFVLESVYADAIIGRQRDELDVERVVLHRIIRGGAAGR